MSNNQILPNISADLVGNAMLQKGKGEGLFVEKDRDFIEESFDRYRKFLFLVKKYGSDENCPLAPSRDIDAIWHLHMLSPVSYSEDCNDYIGSLLDHRPCGYDEKTRQANIDAFERAKELFHQEFNEPYHLNDSYERVRAACLCTVAGCWS